VTEDTGRARRWSPPGPMPGTVDALRTPPDVCAEEAGTWVVGVARSSGSRSSASWPSLRRPTPWPAAPSAARSGGPARGRQGPRPRRLGRHPRPRGPARGRRLGGARRGAGRRTRQRLRSAGLDPRGAWRRTVEGYVRPSRLAQLAAMPASSPCGRSALPSPMPSSGPARPSTGRRPGSRRATRVRASRSGSSTVGSRGLRRAWVLSFRHPSKRSAFLT